MPLSRCRAASHEPEPREKTIEDSWQSYRKKVLTDLPEDLMDGPKMTYFAGAWGLYSVIVQATAACPDEPVTEILARLVQELNDFFENL